MPPPPRGDSDDEEGSDDEGRHEVVEVDGEATGGAYKMNCRMYEREFPEIDEVVMVQVSAIAEMGAYVRLLEYNNIEGMILLSELSRRRIRSKRGGLTRCRSALEGSPSKPHSAISLQSCCTVQRPLAEPRA